MENETNDWGDLGDGVPAGFRSGFVALLGVPNAGKSTLLNALIDLKIAIVSSKPQTTRDRISGIYTDDACQIVFVDTPGVMDPRDRFNECLRDSALEALDGVDAVFHLVDAGVPRPLPEKVQAALRNLRKPLFLLMNKTDCLKNSEVLLGELGKSEKAEACRALLGQSFEASAYAEVFFISARDRRGLEPLLEATRAVLPEGPMFYDPEQPTDRNMRFLASEIVREKVLENCEEEVPYAVATQTEEFVERPESKHFIRVVIFVEHESQKAIVIGKQGEKLRKIGSLARPEIEELADHPVFLELWVKVRKNWRKKETDLREFGYQSKKAHGKKRKRGGRK